jgi:hypothetical protein
MKNPSWRDLDAHARVRASTRFRSIRGAVANVVVGKRRGDLLLLGEILIAR